MDHGHVWYSVIINLGGLYQWSLTILEFTTVYRGGTKIATDGVSFFLAMFFLAPNMAAQSMPSK